MMKKKNKGFSIPELLAVIVIMGILVTIATASYNGISNSLKQKTYDNKISLIKTKAIEYAMDKKVNIATISVATLLQEGYLDMDANLEDEYGNKKLGVISNPCIGAGIYSIVSNFDSARVDGITYREMLDFAVKHGFDCKQLDDLFIWRICFISKRAIVKEKASGVRKTDVKTLIHCTKKYPYAWAMLYPYILAPTWICKIAVRVNEKKKYNERLHLNREGDVIG